MGWASGSGIAARVWHAIADKIPDRKQKRVAQKLIHIFEMEDCDTIDEAEELCKAAGRVFNEETGDYDYV